MVCRIQLREIPSRCESMEAVHEGGIVPHLRRKRTQQMSDPLLLLDIHIEIADHDDSTLGADVFLAAAQRTGSGDPSIRPLKTSRDPGLKCQEHRISTFGSDADYQCETDARYFPVPEHRRS